MSIWSNNGPNPHAGIITKQKPSKQFSGVPNFKQNSGTINGTSPKVGGVAAPSPVNTKSIIDGLSTFLTIQH